jgi:hypothetical protein
LEKKLPKKAYRGAKIGKSENGALMNSARILPLKIHGYLGAKPLKTTPSEKRTCNYFLTSIFLDLTVR